MPLPQRICAIMSPRELRANRIVLMLRYLAEQGVKVDIHICASPGLISSDYQTTSKSLPHRLHMARGIYTIPVLGLLLFLLWGIFWINRQYIKRSEMVMISHYTFLPVAFWSKVIFKKRIWYDVRDMMVYYVSPNYPAALGSLLGIWERLFMPWVDLVTSVDSHRNFWIQRYRNMGKPTEVIYNVPSLVGVDAEAIAHSIATKDLDGPLDVVVVGAITDDQGIGQLMQVLADLGRPCRLYLYGMIHPALKRRLAAEAASGDAACQVFTLPWIPYIDLVNAISRYHIGVMLKNPGAGQYGLLANGNARKIFTYMQAGLPVLVPRFKSVALFIEQEQVGFRVDVSDPQDIARGLREIMADATQYRCMAARGLHLIEDKYNWEGECRKLVRFLQS